MTDRFEPEIDLQQVLAEINAEVAHKVESGVYSETLEDELRSHFARLLERGKLDRSESVWSAVDQLEQLRSAPFQASNTASRIPGGELAHRAAGRIVDRRLVPANDRSALVLEATVIALRAIATALEQPTDHIHADLLHELDTLQDRLAALERRVAHVEPVLDDIADRVTHVAVGDTVGFSSDAFDAMFRGARDDILVAYAELADRFVDAPGPVLDIGCGRGELLELLGERGVEAWGVDTDPELVQFCTSRALDARNLDALSALLSVENGSLGAVTLIQVAEHLAPRELFELVLLAADKLAQGGTLLLEIPNAASLYTHSHALWLDPTHVQPLHPMYLEFLVRQAGFPEVDRELTELPPEPERLQGIGVEDPDLDAVAENFRRLDALLFSAQNVRVIATRSMRIDQFVVGASPSDAITEAARLLHDAFRPVLESRVYAWHRDPRLAGWVGMMADYPSDPHTRVHNDLIVYHASMTEGGLTDFLVGRPQRLMVVYHNVTPATWFDDLDPAFAELLRRARRELPRLLARADLIAADSEFNARELRELGARDVRVVAPTINLPRLHHAEDDPLVVRYLDERAPQRIVLCVGQLLPHKCMNQVLAAHHTLVTDELPDTLLVLAGYGRNSRFRRALERYRSELGLDSVWITGEVTDAALATLYRRADVVVTASEHEGFCVPLVEAFSFGVPVVARSFGAVPETAGDAALVLPAESGPLELAEAVRRVLTDEELRAALVARGYARAELFSAERSVAGLLGGVLDMIRAT